MSAGAGGAARRGQAGVVQAAAGWELVSACAPQVIPACRTPSSPKSRAVNLGLSQPRGSCVPCPVPVCWGTSGRGDPIAGPRDFSLADRSETSISCGRICKSTTSSAAVVGATGGQGRGHPGEGSRNRAAFRRCPPAPPDIYGWFGEGVQLFYRAVIATTTTPPPIHRAVNTQLSTSAWSCLPCRCW